MRTMRLSSVHYLLREGVRGIWQNRLMAVASVGVLVACLLLTGGAYLAVVNMDHAFEWVYEQNVVVVYMQEDVPAADLPGIQRQIERLDNVTRVDFLSKETQLEHYFRDTLEKETFETVQGENNPLLDAFVVTMADMEQFDATVMQLGKLARVDEVMSRPDVADTLVHVRRLVLSAGGWIIGLLLLVSVFIIVNTIRLTVHARRLEVFIMKSVGATNAFVRLPFLIEGMVLGLLSGGLALGLLALGYHNLAGRLHIGMMSLLPLSQVTAVLTAGFLAAGFLIGLLGSGISIGRYLKEDSLAEL